MKSRIRVKNVLEHKIPDRIPIDFGWSCSDINTYKSLQET